MRFRHVVAALALAGCTPKIGDHCSQSTDCSQLGDRLCDIAQPNGYCTIFNCEPNTCPDAVCVAFHDSLDPACMTDPNMPNVTWPRFERTFCMRPCNSDNDCRVNDGYHCVSPGDYAAKIVDSFTGRKVCMFAPTTPPATTTTAPPGVCTSSSSTASSSSSSSSSSSASSSSASSSSGAGGAGGKGGSGAGGKGGAGGSGGKGAGGAGGGKGGAGGH